MAYPKVKIKKLKVGNETRYETEYYNADGELIVAVEGKEADLKDCRKAIDGEIGPEAEPE